MATVLAKRKWLLAVGICLVGVTALALFFVTRRGQSSAGGEGGSDAKPVHLTLLPCDEELVPVITRELIDHLTQMKQFTLNRPLFQGGIADSWLKPQFGQSTVGRVFASVRFGRMLTLLQSLTPADRVQLLKTAIDDTLEEYSALYQRLYPFDRGFATEWPPDTE